MKRNTPGLKGAFLEMCDKEIEGNNAYSSTLFNCFLLKNEYCILIKYNFFCTLKAAQLYLP